MAATYSIWERSTGPAGRARTTYEIRDQDGRVVARERVWAQAHRKLQQMNEGAEDRPAFRKVG